MAGSQSACICVWMNQCPLQASKQAKHYSVQLVSAWPCSCSSVCRAIAACFWPCSAATRRPQSQRLHCSSVVPVWSFNFVNFKKNCSGPWADFSAEALLQSAGKGKPLPAVVEAVANGSTLRVSLLPDLTPVTVLVVGTQVSFFPVYASSIPCGLLLSHCALALRMRTIMLVFIFGQESCTW